MYRQPWTVTEVVAVHGAHASGGAPSCASNGASILIFVRIVFGTEYAPEDQVYRGRPTVTKFRLAYGYSGDMNIEVVQQSDDAHAVAGPD